MKTLVRKEDNVSIYLFDDNKVVKIESNRVVVGDPAEFIIADCNSDNTTLFTNVTTPDEWVGWKYLYTKTGGWELNPNWNPPEVNE